MKTKKDAIIDLLECDNFIYNVLRQSTFPANSKADNYLVDQNDLEARKAIEEAREIILFENRDKKTLSHSENDELKTKILKSLKLM